MSNHHLGFDLGHADSAIALASGREADRFAAPANLEVQGQQVQPTALARTADGRRLVGTRAIREAAKAEARGDGALRAAFKARPGDLGEARADIADFFAEMLAEVAFDPAPPEGWAGAAIAVGCPSGWSATDDAARYAEILRGGLADTPMSAADVTVVPESRAALLQAIENPLSPLSVEARADNILVIDVGSSTLDMSLIAPEQKAAPLLDAGLDLGASFFDRQVLADALDREPGAKAFLDLNPRYRDLWLYYARRTKEQWFLDRPEDPAEAVTGAPLQPYFAGGRRRSLGIDVTGDAMARFRAAPYDRPLRPSPELNLDPDALSGLSWEGAYRAALTAMRDAVERRGAGLGRVLLAGGASRMPFTEEIAREVFADGHPVLRDPEPAHMVSRGLARWSRRRVGVERFALAAEALMADRLPRLTADAFPALRERLAGGLATVVFTDFVEPTLRQWRDGAFRTGEDVRAEIESRVAAWLRSDEGSAFFVSEINAWWRQAVKHDLDAELDKLHTAFDVSRDVQLSLADAIDPHAFRFDARAIDLPFEQVIGAAILALAFALTVAIDAHFGFIPVTTGTLAAAVLVGGKPMRAWLAKLDVPAFARRLPGRLPGRDRLFGDRVRARVERELSDGIDAARAGLLAQVQAAVAASVRRQTGRARLLLHGADGALGRAGG